MIDKIVTHLPYLPYIFYSIYFNFRYLPFKQAVRLPILLHKPLFRKCYGSVVIDAPNIETGMIRLGARMSGIHRNNGVIWENEGKVVFKGRACVSSGCAISVGLYGTLILGHACSFNADSKIVCWHYVELGDYVHSAWNVIIIDTDFHSIKNAFTHKKIKAYAPIVIGSYNWIGQRSLILKGVKTPNHIIISAASVLNRKYKCEENSIISGNPASVTAEGCYYRDWLDDAVDYCDRK